jgi:hypothetical protein
MKNKCIVTKLIVIVIFLSNKKGLAKWFASPLKYY